MLAVGGEGAGGNDVVDVGMVVHGAAPGVKNAGEARQVRAEEAGISGELLESRGRGLEEGVVAGALVAAHDGAKGLGQGEGEQEVRAGKLSIELGIEPEVGFVGLALGAVAVAAGAMDRVGGAAVGTRVQWYNDVEEVERADHLNNLDD